jgi:CRP-like cAMP-binding protein
MLCSHILLAPAPTASMIRLGVRTATFAIDYYVADTAMIGKSRTALLTQTHRQLRYAGIIHDADGAARTDDAKCAAVVDELPIFARLSAEHRATIAKHLKRITIHNGDVVFAKGEEADRLIMIAAGVIDVSGGGADAQSDRLGRAGPGEAIGDIGLIAGEARPYTARAASDGILYTLDRDDLLSLIQENQTFAAELERSASEHFDLLQAPADERAIPVGHTPFFLKALRRHLRPARHPEQP